MTTTSISEHLEKAKGALAAAREALVTAQYDHSGRLIDRVEVEFARHLAVANTQAQVASAEALTRIADAIDGKLG